MNDQAELRQAMMESAHQVQVQPHDIAIAVRRMRKLKMTIKQIADVLDRSNSTVYRYLRLAKKLKVKT